MNPIGSNNLSLKYQRFKPLDCKDIGIRKFEFVTKTRFSFESWDFLNERHQLNPIFQKFPACVD